MSIIKDKIVRSKKILAENEAKVVLIVGFVLISVISFEAGALKCQDWQQAPLVVEKPTEATIQGGGVNGSVSLAGETENEVAKTQNQVEPKSECIFVGSRNSDKYHPTENCRWADAIKEENRVCFSSEEDAERKGYIKSSCFK